MTSPRFAGKVALVTGAASGIGAAIADRLVAEGGSVAAVDRRVIPERGTQCWTSIQADLTLPVDVVGAIEQCTERLGPIDLLFANAGIQGAARPLHELSLEEWDEVMAINLRGTFVALRGVIPRMIAHGGGAIVVTASLGGFRASVNSSPYMASKGGVIMLTRTAALEYVDAGIRVNAVCPGAVDTALLDPIPRTTIDALISKVPMGRLAQPSEVAALALFLASDEAAFITGQTYIIDGGRSAG